MAHSVSGITVPDLGDEPNVPSDLEKMANDINAKIAALSTAIQNITPTIDLKEANQSGGDRTVPTGKQGDWINPNGDGSAMRLAFPKSDPSRSVKALYIVRLKAAGRTIGGSANARYGLRVGRWTSGASKPSSGVAYSTSHHFIEENAVQDYYNVFMFTADDKDFWFDVQVKFDFPSSAADCEVSGAWLKIAKIMPAGMLGTAPLAGYVDVDSNEVWDSADLTAGE